MSQQAPTRPQAKDIVGYSDRPDRDNPNQINRTIRYRDGSYRVYRYDRNTPPPQNVQPWDPYGHESGGGVDPDQQEAWDRQQREGARAPAVRGSQRAGYLQWDPERGEYVPVEGLAPPTIGTPASGVWERQPDGTYSNVIPPQPGASTDTALDWLKLIMEMDKNEAARQVSQGKARSDEARQAFEERWKTTVDLPLTVAQDTRAAAAQRELMASNEAGYGERRLGAGRLAGSEAAKDAQWAAQHRVGAGFGTEYGPAAWNQTAMQRGLITEMPDLESIRQRVADDIYRQLPGYGEVRAAQPELPYYGSEEGQNALHGLLSASGFIFPELRL
jgi:hypothetical protein